MASSKKPYCSFQNYVGGICSFARSDRKKKCTEIVSLLSCNKDISGHNKLLSISGITDEVDLILSRVEAFVETDRSSSVVAQLTICPSHRFNLGLGWYRCSQKCRVPNQLSRHGPKPHNWPKAERGMGKTQSQEILRKTGKFVPVGSGTVECLLVLFYMKKIKCCCIF